MIMSVSLSAAFWGATKVSVAALIAMSPAISIFGERPKWSGDINRIMDRLINDMPLRNGLEELLKNSKDWYVEISLSSDDRFILLISDFANDSFHIVDLGGMDSKKVTQWRRWADDSALSVAGEGGQGLGGKSAMINLPSEYSTIETVKDGILNKMGFDPDAGGMDRYSPAYVIGDDGLEMKDIACKDAHTRLVGFLSKVGIKLSAWDDWEEFQEVLKARQSYTVVTLKGLRDHIPEGHRKQVQFARDLYEKLRMGPQIQKTMEESMAYFFDAEGLCRLLDPVYPEGIEGIDDYSEMFSEERADPQSGNSFHIEGHLVLKASRKDMKTQPRLKDLNNIRVMDANNTVWNIPMDDAADHPLACRHSFGAVQVNADLSKYADTKRSVPPDQPIARAILEVVREKGKPFFDQVATSLTTKANEKRDDRHLNRQMAEIQKKLREHVKLDRIRPDHGPDDGVLGKLTTEQVTELFFYNIANPLSELLILLEGVPKAVIPIVRGESGGQRATVVDEDGRRADAKLLVELVSSDPTIVDVQDFNLVPLSAGECIITMRIRPLLKPQHPDAEEISWAMEVTSLSEAPKVHLDPDPELMFMHSNIKISGKFSKSVSSPSGTPIQSFENNTGYQVSIDGDGSMISQFPPSFRTRVIQDGRAKGTVNVRWGPDPEQVVTCDFETSTDLYEPRRREASKGKDGARGGMSIPQLKLCGDEVDGYPGETMEENSELPTQVRSPTWDSRGIVWLNPGSRKGLAMTHNPSTGKPYRTASVQWTYFLVAQYGEMAADFLVGKLAAKSYGNELTEQQYRELRDQVEMEELSSFYDSFTGVPSSQKRRIVPAIAIVDEGEEE